jgi:hypothetical protein
MCGRSTIIRGNRSTSSKAVIGAPENSQSQTLEAAMRTGVAALIFIASLSSVSAATYTIQKWPQDLNKVPCDAWKHNSDGTWVEVGPSSSVKMLRPE